MAAVPASRADIFKDKSLSLSDKRLLMRFFKLITDHMESEDGMIGELTAGDLDRPFVELLRQQKLPAAIQEYVESALVTLYATILGLGLMFRVARFPFVFYKYLTIVCPGTFEHQYIHCECCA